MKRLLVLATCALTYTYGPGRLALAQHAGGHSGGGGAVGGGQYAGASHPSHSVGAARPTSQVSASQRPPHSPIFRVRPIHRPGFPFFTLGLGFGFNSLWEPTCASVWGSGYVCGSFPLTDDSYQEDGSDNEEAQMGVQQDEALLYEYDYPPTPLPKSLERPGNQALTQLYLTDGTVYDATDYWVVNDQLHFRTLYGDGTESVEHVMVFHQLDTQRTLDANAQRAIPFVLQNRPLPSPAPPSPQLPRRP